MRGDSTKEDFWKGLAQKDVTPLTETPGNVLVLCSPPWGLLARATATAELDEGGDDEEEAQESGIPPKVHQPDIALQLQAIHTFAHGVHTNTPDRTIVALHLPHSLFHVYAKAMKKNGWNMLTQPITIVSPTAPPRGFRTTQFASNADYFFVFYKQDTQYKPSIHFLSHLKDDKDSKAFYHQLARCGHTIKNKIPPSEKCHAVRHIADTTAKKLKEAHKKKQKKLFDEGKLDKKQYLLARKHPNLVQTLHHSQWSCKQLHSL